ncbi:AraC family transcriptional regulator [Neisseria iguanae]|uniref:AraC family transcriptional regulator n=1 Tax=Neisseria iguanae TaxID=90242 RepID=A0A2P7TY74_9NEIS|nr:AraC family transcriptional regulator [Neisseria iguanae]PSJ79603.1 AraC family transcriptional regulator [Neisseria iguanae]
MSQKIILPPLAFRRFADLGLNNAALLTAAGIAANHNDKISLDSEQYFALFNAIARQSSDPLIGLKLGQVGEVSMLDNATFAAVHSANTTKALDRLAMYKKLVCPELISWQWQQDGLAVSLAWAGSETVPDILIDAFFANLVSLLCIGLGETVRPLVVQLCRSHIPAGYTDYFACEIHTNAPGNQILFSNSLKERPFITHNPDLLDLILPTLERRLPAKALPTLSEQVKQMLYEMMNGCCPTIDTVAGRLNISRRTLQRKLADNGQSYQALLDEVRQDLACQMLDQTDLQNGEIAFYLGFSEANSFHRFFVQKTGKTPVEWRSKR